MAPPFVLCQPSVQLPSSHASARNHPAFCPSPRHHPRPRPASGHERPSAHSLGNRTPPTTPWRVWTHQRLPSQPVRLLGFLGRHTAQSPAPIPDQHGHHPPTPSQRDSCRPITAGNQRSAATTPTSRLQPSQLGGTGRRPSCPPAPWTRPSTSNPRSRMANARRPVIPPQFPPRTPQPSRPPAKPCWIPSRNRTPVVRWPRSPLVQTQHTNRISSESCSWDASVPRYLCRLAAVGAVAFSIPWATTVQLVPRQEYFNPEESHSKKQAARVCREAGARVTTSLPARVTTNTRLMNLNIDNIQRQDDRRIEIIANGLPLWGGVQLAIDTTLVSPLTRASEPRSRAGRYAGAAVQDAQTFRKNARTPHSSKHDAANLSC